MRPGAKLKESVDRRRRNGATTRIQRERGSSRSSSQINEMLKMCLEKICELQHDLERQQDLEDDPQAAGYAACAIETLKFLAQEGLPTDHPMVKILTEKLTDGER